MGSYRIAGSELRMSKVFGVGALAFCCVAAWAQGPGGGGPGGGLSPEDRAKAWDLEARAVAADLSLSAEDTTKLVDAYKAARESQAAVMRERMSSGGGDRRDPSAMIEANKAERDKLKAALAAFLKEEQVDKALAALGGFNRRWDTMTLALENLGLEGEKKAEATKLVMAYVAESDKAMQEAMAGGDWESMRTKGRTMREELDAKLGKVLSPEQLAKWKEATAMRGGGPRQP